MNTEMISTGLQLSLYGLGGVFTVLILFYVLVRIMMVVSNRFVPEPDENNK